jgi:hypothetical protein
MSPTTPCRQVSRKISGCALALATGLLFALSFALRAQEVPGAPEIKPGASPPIHEVGGGVFEVGKICFDKNAKSATFAASVNMNSGAVEYMLVRAGGKTHESMFVTDVQPYYLHIAMLLLGAKGSQKKSDAATPPDTISGAYLQSAPEPTGDVVSISVSWKDDGTTRRANADDLLLANKKNASAERGMWLYTGSLLTDGRFLAQGELSIVSLVIDPAALINNERPGNRDDSAWEIDPKKLPPVGTPVEITIKLEEPPKK